MKKRMFIVVLAILLISSIQIPNSGFSGRYLIKPQNFAPNLISKAESLNFNYNADKIEVAVTPDHAFNLVKEAIQSANESIFIEIYQFWSEDIFQLINQTLHTKNNLKVRILIENDTGYRGSIGGADQYNRFYAKKFYDLGSQGFDVIVRLEPTWTYYHGKLIIIDNKTAVISSDNFVPTAFPSNPNTIEKIEYNTPSRGWVAKIDDVEVVGFYLDLFNIDFQNSVNYDPVRDGVGEAPPDYGSLAYTPYFYNSITVENVPMIPVASPVNSNKSLVDLLLSANHTIIIEQIYVYESAWYLIDILKKVHDEKNVTVMIILEDDYPGTYNNFKDNLTALGFHVLPAFDKIGDSIYLHNKGIIIDDKIVFIGSINWSGGSINYNREYGVIIESRPIAAFLRKVYEFDWNSSLVTGMEAFDSDGDGLPNYYEIEHGLDKNNPDTDGDGYSDYEEVYILGTDPTAPNYVSTDVFTVYSPNNGSYYNRTSVNLVVKLNTTGVSEVKVYLNNVLIFDITSFASNWINETITATEGVNELYLEALNSTFATIDKLKITFIVDTRPPIVNIVKPFNDTIFAVTENITLRWTVHDINYVKSIIYLDGKYFTETTGYSMNISIFDNKIRTGTHILLVEAVDAAGNKGSSVVFFGVSKPLVKIVNIIPGNNTKLYEDTVLFSIRIESKIVKINNVTVENGGVNYTIQESGTSSDVYIFSGEIRLSDEVSTLYISTDFYVFKYKLVYSIERNPVIRFLYTYRYEIALFAILLVIALIRYKFKKR